ncbi:unnamed protein product [Amoebophrya sp. A25]|nr:unnamed protein product [Amoebophrya sp. A25]|eukprot:GSA25T00026157001.1
MSTEAGSGEGMSARTQETSRCLDLKRESHAMRCADPRGCSRRIPLDEKAELARQMGDYDTARHLQHLRDDELQRRLLERNAEEKERQEQMKTTSRMVDEADSDSVETGGRSRTTGPGDPARLDQSSSSTSTPVGSSIPLGTTTVDQSGATRSSIPLGTTTVDQSGATTQQQLSSSFQPGDAVSFLEVSSSSSSSDQQTSAQEHVVVGDGNHANYQGAHDDLVDRPHHDDEHISEVEGDRPIAMFPHQKNHANTQHMLRERVNQNMDSDFLSQFILRLAYLAEAGRDYWQGTSASKSSMLTQTRRNHKKMGQQHRPGGASKTTRKGASSSSMLKTPTSSKDSRTTASSSSFANVPPSEATSRRTSSSWWSRARNLIRNYVFGGLEVEDRQVPNAALPRGPRVVPSTGVEEKTSTSTSTSVLDIHQREQERIKITVSTTQDAGENVGSSSSSFGANGEVERETNRGVADRSSTTTTASSSSLLSESAMPLPLALNSPSVAHVEQAPIVEDTPTPPSGGLSSTTGEGGTSTSQPVPGGTTSAGTTGPPPDKNIDFDTEVGGALRGNLREVYFRKIRGSGAFKHRDYDFFTLGKILELARINLDDLTGEVKTVDEDEEEDDNYTDTDEGEEEDDPYRPSGGPRDDISEKEDDPYRPSGVDVPVEKEMNYNIVGAAGGGGSNQHDEQGGTRDTSPASSTKMAEGGPNHVLGKNEDSTSTTSSGGQIYPRAPPVVQEGGMYSASSRTSPRRRKPKKKRLLRRQEQKTARKNSGTSPARGSGTHRSSPRGADQIENQISDDRRTWRETGVAIQMDVVWTNLVPWGSTFGYKPISYTYKFSRLPADVDSMEYRKVMTDLELGVDAEGRQHRWLFRGHGVAITARISGEYAQFKPLYFSILCLSFIGMACGIQAMMDYTLVYLLPESSSYFPLLFDTKVAKSAAKAAQATLDKQQERKTNKRSRDQAGL